MFNKSLMCFLLLPALLLTGCIITGKVIDEDGKGIKGVTVTLSGNADMTTTTDSKGEYKFGDLTNMLTAGSYTGTPSRSGCTFTPSSKNVIITTQPLSDSEDVPWPVGGVDFQARCQTTFGGWSLNMEYRDLRPEENFVAAYAYACQTCSISQFDAIEVAPGFDKRPVRINLFDSGRMTQAFPAPLDGTPTGLDLIPGVTDLFGADEEFILIAKVLSAVPIFTPAGPIGYAQVQRYADLTYSQGTVVHEIINTQDEHFILFTAHLSLESTVGGGTIDFRQAGSLGDYVAPYLQTGWSYSSYVLGSDLTVYSEGQASVLGMPGLSWQKY